MLPPSPSRMLGRFRRAAAPPLGLAFAVLGLLIAAVAALGFERTRRDAVSARRIVSVTNTTAAVNALKFDSADISGWQVAYAWDVAVLGHVKALHAVALNRRGFIDRADSIRDDLRGVQVRDLTPDERRRFERIRSNFARFFALDDRIVALYETGRRADARRARDLITGLSYGVYYRITDETNQLLEEVSRRNHDAVDGAAHSTRVSSVVIAVCGLVALVLAGALGVLALRAGRRHERVLRRQALHDALTGLPNRVLLDEVLTVALADGASRPVVLLLDVDRFKHVNDSYGHVAGDELLVHVARRLRTIVRSDDLLARFGGDEFVLVLPGRRTDEALTVAERVLRLFDEPFRLREEDFWTTASIGVAVADDATASPASLLRDADAAMYRAKRDRTGIAVFDATMRADVVERLRCETALRHALQRDELRLRLQPVVDLADGSLHGFEALVRWQHPERGLLGPGEFIDVAEDSGLVVPLGRWVLRETCRRLAQWDERRPDGRPYGAAVNLSARQLAQPGLAADVRAALDEWGVDPGRLTLEITESILVEDSDASATALSALKALGVALALDDFGTGYSSLGYIQRFPLDAVKLDRSFVAGLGDRGRADAIAAAVAALGDALGLTVVAEGIETDAQLAAVRRLGARLGQGYLFARPLDPETVLEQLRADASNGRSAYLPAA